MQAGVHAADLGAWIDGAPAPCTLSGLGANPNPSPGVASELQGLRLFGTNDYLGLSVHPDVCRAAAAAAMQARRAWAGSMPARAPAHQVEHCGVSVLHALCLCFMPIAASLDQR